SDRVPMDVQWVALGLPQNEGIGERLLERLAGARWIRQSRVRRVDAGPLSRTACQPKVEVGDRPVDDGVEQLVGEDEDERREEIVARRLGAPRQPLGSEVDSLLADPDAGLVRWVKLVAAVPGECLYPLRFVSPDDLVRRSDRTDIERELLN